MTGVAALGAFGHPGLPPEEPRRLDQVTGFGHRCCATASADGQPRRGVDREDGSLPRRLPSEPSQTLDTGKNGPFG